MENSKREKIVSHFSVISQLKWLMNEFLVIFSPHQRIKKVLQDLSFSKNRAEVEYLWELFFFSFLMTFHFLSHISSDSIYHFTTENSDWEVSVLFSAFHVSTLKLSIFVVRFDKLPISYFEVERESARGNEKFQPIWSLNIKKHTLLPLTHTHFFWWCFKRLTKERNSFSPSPHW